MLRAFLVHFQGIIEDYLEVVGVGGRGSRRVSVRHEWKAVSLFVLARGRWQIPG